MKTKIALALEPMESSLSRVRLMVKAARLWNKKADILPLSYVTPIDVGWPLGLFSALEENIDLLSDTRLLPALRKVAPKIAVDAHILSGSTTSKRQAVEDIVDRAKEEGAELILVGSHGHQGFDRMRLGSFAETLIAMSPLPTLVVNQKTLVPSKIKTIFFPTDYSVSSKKIFKNTLAIAKEFKAKLILCHILELPSFIGPSLPGYIDGDVIAKVIDMSREDQKETGRKWQTEALKAGVKCELETVRANMRRGNLFLAEAKRQKADLMVLATRAGVVSQALFGSDLRQVLCQSTCPVMVIHA